MTSSNNSNTAPEGTPRIIDAFLQKAEKRNHWFYIPFWVIGGGMPQLLKYFPEDWNKYFGAGAAILMTAVFAAISGGYAISTIFNDAPYAPYIFGVIWGFFILLLDRYFVTSMVKTPQNSLWNGFKVAWIRILLAIFIGFIISRPLELRIAQPEIDIALDSIYQNTLNLIDVKYDSLVAIEENRIIDQSQLSPFKNSQNELRSKIKEYESGVLTLEEKVDALAKLVQCECKGDCGTGIPGRGPACKFHEERYRDAKIELDAKKKEVEKKTAPLEIELSVFSDSIEVVEANSALKKKERIKEIEEKRDLEKSNYKASNRESLINRNKILHQLARKDMSVLLIIVFLTALFIFIETAPILIKLITQYGAYDAALATLRERGQQQAKLDRNISKEEIKLNRILLGQISRAQQEILSEKVAIWEQKNKLKNSQEAEAVATGEFISPDYSTDENDHYSPNDPFEDLNGNNNTWENPDYDDKEED